MKLVQPQFAAVQFKIESANIPELTRTNSSPLSYALLSGTKDDFSRVSRSADNNYLNDIVRGNFPSLSFLEAVQTHFSKFENKFKALPDQLQVILKENYEESQLVEVLLRATTNQNYEHSESTLNMETSLGLIDADRMASPMGERILNEVLAKAKGMARAMAAVNDGSYQPNARRDGNIQ